MSTQLEKWKEEARKEFEECYFSLSKQKGGFGGFQMGMKNGVEILDIDAILEFQDTLITQIATQSAEAERDRIAEMVNTKHPREMSEGENRSKYLAFWRGENHMRSKILKALSQEQQ